MELIKIHDKKGIKKILLKVSLVTFKEDKSFIVYSPSLDLSGYGDTEAEAKKSFETTLTLTVGHCIEKNTFRKMLESLGWFKGIGSQYKTVGIAAKINTNDYLQQLFNKNKEVKLTNDYEVEFG